MAKRLIQGDWLEDSCESEGFSFYEAEILTNDKEMIFLWEIISVEPVDESGDPDLYISNKDDFPDFSKN